ncbi:hypothetical protein PVAND_013028 [Polypedilum vanderplanki]|uniref:ornithine decarboxylase n=1 Tax=Polypedilum vanderplanki TaxID=319348 RepID=A0A9J6CQ76_POLVA|nr:hypothetical protein PVAND_013028 [Polypedilum vanderplanki]
MDLIKLIESRLAEGNDDSFYILNLEDVRLKYRLWMEKIPRVVPYYAVKCNDLEEVLNTLRDLGAGFDCASKKEIHQMLALNVDKEKILYTHTAKQISHLKYSAEQNIEKITFDSVEELEKIKKVHPNAKVVLRIRFDAASSIINLGIKFGCDPIKEAPKFIELCKDMNMNLIGISFHVGSGTQDFGIFERALATVRELFDFAATIGFKLNFVDIGGGFIGENISLLDNYAKSINTGIDKNFPSSNEVEIVAEPGRYFVDSAFSIATQIVLKKSGTDGQIHYYLNESIYMSFLIAFLYKSDLKFTIIRKSKMENETKSEKLSTLWGCTCNSMDKIMGDCMMKEMEIGDWLIFHNMGAYTLTVSTKFNGFENNKVFILK